MGGLAAAIRLAASGVQVTILEAASVPGGKMRTTDSVAGPIDSGPTVLTLRGIFEDLFASAGESMGDHLRLLAPDVIARHLWSDGATLDLHADPERNARAIRAFAGVRAEGEFRAFSAQARALHHAFDAPMIQAARPDPLGVAVAALSAPRTWSALLPGRTLAGALRARFTDPRLRQLFGRYATYVGGAPALSPAVLGLIWDVEQAGVWAVEGGMARLAQALALLAQARGAELLTDCAVERIDAPDGTVRSVRLAGGGTIRCDALVFNGDPAALATGLMGPDCRRAVTRSAVDPRSLSARVWAFAARPRGVELALHTVFFADSEDAEFGALAQGQHPQNPTIYVCAQDRLDPVAPQGAERFEMILNAPALAQGDACASQEFETCRQMTFDRLRRFGLTFGPMTAPPVLTRAQDFARLFPGSAGALYGRSPAGMAASFRRPTARTRIKGLYLAGGGVHPGPGIPMATLSGRHAAEAIMHDRALTWQSRPMAMRGGMSTG